MILYTRVNEVKSRLLGKVKWSSDPLDETAMTDQLLSRLISQAEGSVELDLSQRYETPFVTRAGLPFASLVERPTKEFLRTLCELLSVIRVLETDFGRGSSANSEGYTKKLQERYDEMIKKHLSRRSEDEGQNQFLYPPLPDLKLAYFNSLGDDGYRGQVLSTNDLPGGMGYPAHRINDPEQSYSSVLYEENEDII